MPSPEPVLESLSPARQTRLCYALALLMEARDDASHLNRDHWQFAIPLGELLLAGSTGSDLRWLTVHEFVDHALDQSAAHDPARSFLPVRNLSLSPASAFILTDRGASLAEGLRVEGRRPQLIRVDPPHKTHIPLWNRQKRELRCEEQLVKQFRVPAPSQETILGAFEEDGWPSRIDDPLPPRPGRDPQQRLHDAVRGLNRNQNVRVLHFFRDGTGVGVCWKTLLPEPFHPSDGERPRIGAGSRDATG